MNAKKAKKIRRVANSLSSNLNPDNVYRDIKSGEYKVAVTQPPECEEGDEECITERALFRPKIRRLYPRDVVEHNEKVHKVPTYTRVLDECRRWQYKSLRRKVERGEFRWHLIEAMNDHLLANRAA